MTPRDGTSCDSSALFPSDRDPSYRGMVLSSQRIDVVEIIIGRIGSTDA